MNATMPRSLAALMFVLFLLSLASRVNAASPRTFVASTGNDANPCSLAQPCRGFAAAIAKTTDGGELIVLDSAGYGPATIMQSITISAPTGIYAGVTVPSGTGFAINGTGVHVTLRGLSLTGTGGSTGVYFQQGAELDVEDCVVAGFSGEGIYATAPAGKLVVRNVVFHDDGYAVNTVGGVVASLDHVQAANNFMAVFANDQSRVSVSHSNFTQNTYGADVTGGTPNATQLVVTQSVLSGNSVGLAVAALAGSTAVLVAENNTISQGNYGFYFFGSGGSEVIYTRGNNAVVYMSSNPVYNGALTPYGGL